jgi:hypothetical protein
MEGIHVQMDPPPCLQLQALPLQSKWEVNLSIIIIMVMMYHLLSSWLVTYKPWVGLFPLSWNIKLLKGK